MMAAPLVVRALYVSCAGRWRSLITLSATSARRRIRRPSSVTSLGVLPSRAHRSNVFAVTPNMSAASASERYWVSSSDGIAFPRMASAARAAERVETLSRGRSRAPPACTLCGGELAVAEIELGSDRGTRNLRTLSTRVTAVRRPRKRGRAPACRAELNSYRPATRPRRLPSAAGRPSSY